MLISLSSITRHCVLSVRVCMCATHSECVLVLFEWISYTFALGLIFIMLLFIAV